MKQIDVKFQSENENHGRSKFTPFGGAVLVGEVFEKFGIDDAIDRYIGARRAGSGVSYTDSSYVRSLVLMQILGGETVDDLATIRDDPVIAAAKGKIPGRTSVHNYLASFVDEGEERRAGRGNQRCSPRANTCVASTRLHGIYCRWFPRFVR